MNESHDERRDSTMCVSGFTISMGTFFLVVGRRRSGWKWTDGLANILSILKDMKAQGGTTNAKMLTVGLSCGETVSAISCVFDTKSHMHC